MCNTIIIIVVRTVIVYNIIYAQYTRRTHIIQVSTLVYIAISYYFNCVYIILLQCNMRSSNVIYGSHGKLIRI